HNKFATRLSQIVSLSILVGAIVAIGVTACKNKITSSAGVNGNFQVALTDSPARFDSVMIDIQKVEVQNVDSTNGWTVINDSSMTVNLLDLTNGTYKVLGEKQLSTGTYPQIRLVLGPDNYVVKNGQRYSMTIPGGQQSGIKINAAARIEPDVTYTLLLDFDSNRSIVTTGNSSNPYILKPVIRASNEATTGSISGIIQPAEAKPVIYGISNSDTLATALPDTSSGVFKIIGLNAGAYTLSIIPADTTMYRDTTLTNVNVSTGETQQLGTITLRQK
ncbi:MAG TPA: DUF4382 domain-containing protein, partial [Balneolales bacterium]|nr:DUF4382 domain-containing protein [Balneolales bacterium]